MQRLRRKSAPTSLAGYRDHTLVLYHARHFLESFLKTNRDSRAAKKQ